MSLKKLETIDLIIRIAVQVGIKPSLACAIASVESSFNHYAMRFEPKWNYFKDVSKYAALNHVSPETERTAQATSWGLMQVMGSVGRELGFQGPLAALSRPEVGILLGCQKLKKLCEKYSDENDVIAAYNAGSPRKLQGGTYENQQYVSKVRRQLTIFRGA